MRRIAKIVLLLLSAVLIVAVGVFYFSDRQVVEGDLAATTVAADRQATEQVLRANIKATNSGDLAGYLATIQPAKRQETATKLGSALAQQKNRLKLRQFKVQKQSATQVVAKIDQLQTTIASEKQQVLEANIEFAKVDGQWYIKRNVLFNVVNIK